MKVVTVVGARPQFIKASAVSRALRSEKSVTELLVHTGQHYDENMSQVFFDELEIPPPAYNLAAGSASHAVSTARILERLEPILVETAPDLVLVYGDTTSTLAGALAAAKLQIPIAHVEAGLRSGNRRMPEEINRIVTDSISDILFAPSEAAAVNLAREGHPSGRIHLVGDVMYDLSIEARERAEKQSKILERFGLRSKEYILATIHRQENTDDPPRLHAILAGLAEVAREVPVLLPVHPRTKKIVGQNGLARHLGSVRLVDPVGYLDMAKLEAHARLIVTDSGGVQKEAFFHEVPAVTLRDETEWVELTDLGWNHLVPPRSAEDVVKGVRHALKAPKGKAANPYGTGDAARKIVNVISRVPEPSR